MKHHTNNKNVSKLYHICSFIIQEQTLVFQASADGPNSTQTIRSPDWNFTL